MDEKPEELRERMPVWLCSSVLVRRWKQHAAHARAWTPGLAEAAKKELAVVAIRRGMKSWEGFDWQWSPSSGVSEQ